MPTCPPTLLLVTAALAAAPALVDVHAHLDPDRPRESVAAARRAIAAGGAARIVFMPPPFTADDPGRYDAELILAAVSGQPGRFTVLGGGGTLNPMIHQAVRSGEAGPELRRRFRERAEELLRLGAAGFGELAAEHFAGATPYQSAPPDHPLFLLLADVAAAHDVPIVLHLEAVPQDAPFPPGVAAPPGARLAANVDALERLLAHDVRARIVWAHAGWDGTGARTPALCRRLLAAHPNLYMDVKIDPARPGLSSPLPAGPRGPIDPAWLALFRDFPDRFVMGTDQHYPEPSAAVQRREAAALLLDQLPAGLRTSMGSRNAARLYRIPPGR